MLEHLIADIETSANSAGHQVVHIQPLQDIIILNAPCVFVLLDSHFILFIKNSAN